MSSNQKPFMNKNETSNADCLQRRVRPRFVVRDLTGVEPSVSADTKSEAESWVRHLTEWKPNARPVIEESDGSTKCCERMTSLVKSGQVQTESNMGFQLRLKREDSTDSISINFCPWCGKDVRYWPNDGLEPSGGDRK